MMMRCTALVLLVLTVVSCVPPTDTRMVTLVADGKSRETATEALTVRDLLTEAEIELDAEDRVTPTEPTLLQHGMTIRVIRVETRAETEQREIPFDRRTVRETSIPEGESQLLEPGVTGIEELIYRITLEDGDEVDRRLVRRVTLREPRTEIILVGAQKEQNPIPITGTIAYVAHHNAWVIRRTSPNHRRLTHDGDLDGRVFALSADGSHLAFTRVPTETEESAPVNTLWILDTSAVDAKPVRLEVESVLWADWEPGCDVGHTASGCRIAYTTGARAEGNPGWRANNDLWTAWARPSTGELVGRREVLEPTSGGSYGWWGTNYAWSPGGDSLAYARADEVGVVRAYDGQQTPLAQFAPYRTYGPWAWAPSVHWSPEGSFIVTTLHGPAPTGQRPEDSPVFDVWALSVDRAITAELSSEAGMWAAPIFAAETGQIAFGRARSAYASQASNYDLYVMDRDGSDRRRVFPADGEIGLEYPEVAWSPESNQIAAAYQENLYLIQVSDGDVHQLTDEGGVTAVRWR